MLRYNKYGSRIFFAPDAGGGAGGSQGNPGANQAGGGANDGSAANANTDPIAGLNLDDFEPAVAKVLKASRDAFASLQTEKAATEKARKEQEAEKIQFQSKFDQLQSQVQKLTGGQQQQQVDPKIVRQNKIAEILKSRGVLEPQAKVQSEVLGEVLEEFATALKGEIGHDLQPFASNVLSRDAEFAWNTASQNDKLAAMQIPEVQKVAWDQVQAMVQHGQQVTPEVIKNLVGMAYFKHLEAGGQQQQQQQQQSMPPQFPNMGRPSFGGGYNPQRPNVTDPNAPKHVLDEATDAALQTVFKTWNKGQGAVKAPGLRTK